MITIKKLLLLLYISTYGLYYSNCNQSLEKQSQSHLPESTQSKKNIALSTEQFDEQIYTWSRVIAHVLQLIRQKHFKVVDLETCMIKSINEMLATLDPHSGLLDPKTYKSMLESTSGEFFGTGIIIDRTRKTNDKFLTIIDTIPEGPAEKAGILALDKIVQIDDELLDQMSTEEAITKLKGPKNTKVTLKIMRNNHHDLISCDVFRDIVKEQSSLSFVVKEHNICYLSLASFSENATKDIEALVHQAQKHKYKGIILDLRNNSGGLLTSAVDICGLFIPKNSIVVTTKNKHGAKIEEYRTKRTPLNLGTIPLIILINNYTASAAEILAGCLKVHSDKATTNSQHPSPNVILVGTTTFGKGSVQELIPIPGNLAVKLTVSLYYLPDESTIQGIGIEPDIAITKYSPPTEETLWFIKQYGHEKSFENHITTEISAEKNKKNTPIKVPQKKDAHWIERSKKMFDTDNQLRESISLINILDAAQKNNPNILKTRATMLDFLNNTYIGNKKLEIEEIKK